MSAFEWSHIACGTWDQRTPRGKWFEDHITQKLRFGADVQLHNALTWTTTHY
jgi:hypothetical protein